MAQTVLDSNNLDAVIKDATGEGLTEVKLTSGDSLGGWQPHPYVATTPSRRSIKARFCPYCPNRADARRLSSKVRTTCVPLSGAATSDPASVLCGPKGPGVCIQAPAGASAGCWASAPNKLLLAISVMVTSADLATASGRLAMVAWSTPTWWKQAARSRCFWCKTRCWRRAGQRKPRSFRH